MSNAHIQEQVWYKSAKILVLGHNSAKKILVLGIFPLKKKALGENANMQKDGQTMLLPVYMAPLL